MKALLVRGSSLAALLAGICILPSAANAQTATGGGDQKVGALYDEIVVTARSREEKLQDTPVAVTAITEKTISRANITKPSDFFQMIPNVTMADSQDAGTVSINVRGIGEIRNGETPVAISVDGVLLSSPLEFKQDLFDIQQIEVLRGPQGALYGRNAIAGAINITTKKPTNDFSGNLKGSYGNGHSFSASAAVSGALIKDKLFIRAGIFRSQTDGFIRNAFLNKNVDWSEDTSVRMRLNWDATDTFSFDLRGFYSTHRGGAAYFVRPLLQVSGRPFFDPVKTVDIANTVIAPTTNNLGFDKRELMDFSLKMDLQTAIGTVTSTTAYSTVDLTVGFDGYDYSNNQKCYMFGFGIVSDGLAACNKPRTFALGPSGDPNGADVQFEAPFNTTFQHYKVKNWSQEIRLTSPSANRLRYILGAYFLWPDRKLVTGTNTDRGFGIVPELNFDPNSANPTSRYFAENNRDSAWSIFGQLNYDINDTVEASISGRFDSDHRKQTDPRVAPYRVDGFGIPVSVPATRQATFQKFQPKFTLRWKPTPNTQVYATAGQGFRSGGFNAPGTEISPLTGAKVADSVYKREVATSYELGLKTDLFDRMFTINGAVFYTRADNLQVFNFNGLVNAQIVTNIDKVDIKGLELELALRPTSGFKLYGSLGYTDAKIKAYAANPASVGNQVPYTAKLTISSGFEYEAYLNQDLSLVLRADWQRRGKTHFHEGGTFVGVPVRNPINFVSGRIALEHHNGWSLALWGKNLLNEIYYEEVVAPDYNYQGRPRSFGIELSTKF